ncbi:MAG: hypothetical protein COA78_33090 [Blastopirellula sp.]|nr:MAG: hypothetical protein COA78_33090 [Blastopirellula sp.]
MTTESTPNDAVHENQHADFLLESTPLISQINQILLVVEEQTKQTDEALLSHAEEKHISNLFRSVHSLTGLSSMAGLSNINCLSINLETLLKAVRTEELSFSGPLLEVTHESVQALSGMNDQLQSGATEAIDYGTILTKMQDALEHAETGNQADVKNGPTTVDTVDSLEEAEDLNAANDAFQEKYAELFAPIQDDETIPEKYLSIFIDEADSTIDEIADTLLTHDDETDGSNNNHLLICTHRIKGSAAAVGLHRPAKLAHFMEDILQELNDSEQGLSLPLTDAMLNCSDGLRKYVQDLKQGTTSDDDFAYLAANLMATYQSKNSPETNDSSTEKIDSIEEKIDNRIASTEQAHEAILSWTGVRQDHLLVINISLEPNLPLSGLKSQLLYEKLTQCSDIIYCEPTEEEYETRDRIEHLTFAVATEQTAEKVQALLGISGVREINLEEVEQETDKPLADETAPSLTTENSETSNTVSEKTAPQTIEKSTALPNTSNESVTNSQENKTKDRRKSKQREQISKPIETLRVDIDRLDQLMNLAGQLVINKARFSQLGDGIRDAMPHKQSAQLIDNSLNLSSKITKIANGENGQSEIDPTELDSMRQYIRRLHSNLETIQKDYSQFTQMRNSVGNLSEAVHQLERVSDGIQKSIMDTRMVPIGPLFGRFRRVIRDIARDRDKSIRLDICGEKTELDKRMIDELGDPLIHMIRNSADHGIETPDERKKAGKPIQGTVKLDAFHRGNSIVIQVIDDGKGLNTVRLLEKAIQKGIVSLADSEKMTSQQIHQLIWEPGFSTAEKVTEISGRGMGMDIVRSKIEEINGAVEVDSVEGVGTTFSIRLPLTMAILPSLLAIIDEGIYSFPIESVIEIVSIHSKDFSTVHGKRTATVRDRIVSIVTFEELLGDQPTAAVDEAFTASESTVVIIGQEGKEVGIAVDSLLGEEDIVVKSLAENYRNVTGISGASILGDGSVSLILDTATLLHLASAGNRQLASI